MKMASMFELFSLNKLREDGCPSSVPTMLEIQDSSESLLVQHSDL